jgi:two-component system chemotaxis response regulator CheY
MVAKRVLQDLAFNVCEATNGQEALITCLSRMPDVVLLDWNMPVMNGIEFLRALRSLPGGDEPVVVFCTTESDVAHIQQAIELGANEYIMKPFDSEIIELKFAQVGLLD